MTNSKTSYYVPDKSPWPIIGSISLFLFVIGMSLFLQNKPYGGMILSSGILGLTVMLYGWFSNVISESQDGLYSKQMDRSFRWGMFWFIFSEVMFFAAFFGALFYTRNMSVPWLGGADNNAATHKFLWDQFVANWPLLNNPDPTKFTNPNAAMGAWGLPAINTLILLTSGATITWAHHGIIKNNRQTLIIGLGLTIFLGISFLGLQAYEYYEAYHHLGLKLNSGIYGSTFFMLTGFHGLHVTIGTLMLIIVWLRCIKGHFDIHNHFAFEAVAWYWHFVDVVWLILFVFVYWL